MPATPRPSTMLPAQNRLASASRGHAEDQRSSPRGRGAVRVVIGGAEVLRVMLAGRLRIRVLVRRVRRHPHPPLRGDLSRVRERLRWVGSIGAGPAVAARVGAGHAHAVAEHADRLHAARALERADAGEAVAESFQAGKDFGAEAGLDR